MNQAAFMQHNQLAVAYWGQGRHRESANEYWAAFQLARSNPPHKASYWMLHGYTSILRDQHFEATDGDFGNLRKIFDAKHEPRLFRLEAGYTLGVLHYARSERQKCEDVYHSAIAIGEKSPKKARDKEIERSQKMIILTAGRQEERTMKELMEGVLEDCQKNLNRLNAATASSVGPDFQGTKTTHSMQVGRGGTSLTQNEFDNLIDVGGIQCDYCKRKGVKMFTCSKCKKGFYCSKECQRKQWTENEHKIHCRKEGEFKPGDLVQIVRLKNKIELNNQLVRVIGPDTSTEGRYKVQMEGAVSGDPIHSVSASNLNQLRPYDCRK